MRPIANECSVPVDIRYHRERGAFKGTMCGQKLLRPVNPEEQEKPEKLECTVSIPNLKFECAVSTPKSNAQL